MRFIDGYMAVGQNLRPFGDAYHPILVYFKGLLGVHRGTGVLTHGHRGQKENPRAQVAVGSVFFSELAIGFLF